MFDSLNSALKELAAEDLASWSDDELDEAVLAVVSPESAMAAFKARLLHEWQARKTWIRDHAGSPSAWLAKRSHTDKRDWGSALWVGRVLSDMPLVAEAYSAGDIGTAHVRRLASVYNARTAAAFARDEAMLVGLAQGLTFLEFSMKVGCWELENDPDGSSDRARDAYDRRDAYFVPSFGGTFLGRQTMDPVSGQLVSDEHLRLDRILFEADWAEARERLGREPTAGELRRSPAQRRHDAFAEMARRSAGADPERSPRPLFTVTVGERAFQWMCRLASGEVVSPAGLIPFLSDAELEAILFDGKGR
ncbi:MAG: DUF222 domain-containing protein, partial [Acidimicrobiia bacterium]